MLYDKALKKSYATTTAEGQHFYYYFHKVPILIQKWQKFLWEKSETKNIAPKIELTQQPKRNWDNIFPSCYFCSSYNEKKKSDFPFQFQTFLSCFISKGSSTPRIFTTATHAPIQSWLSAIGWMVLVTIIVFCWNIHFFRSNNNPQKFGCEKEDEKKENIV